MKLTDEQQTRLDGHVAKITPEDEKRVKRDFEAKEKVALGKLEEEGR